jgi:hypothetical protein
LLRAMIEMSVAIENLKEAVEKDDDDEEDQEA